MENAKIHLLLYHDNLSADALAFYKLTPQEEDYVYSALVVRDMDFQRIVKG